MGLELTVERHADRLLSVKQSIADEKGCTADDVSDCAFNYFGSDDVNISDTYFEFDRVEELEEYPHDYYLI